MKKNRVNSDYNTSPMWGKKIENKNDIYKGDGINTCKWCGDTGWMHTFSNDGYFYNDAPCICKLGREVQKQIKEDRDSD